MLTAAFFNLRDEPKALVFIEKIYGGTMIRFSGRGGSDVEIILADSTLKDLVLKLLDSEVVRPRFDAALDRYTKTVESAKRLVQPAKGKGKAKGKAAK